MIMNKKNPEWTETINYNALEDKIDNKKKRTTQSIKIDVELLVVS